MEYFTYFTETTNLPEDFEKENKMSFIIISGTKDTLYIATDSFNTRFTNGKYGYTNKNYQKIFIAEKCIFSCHGATTLYERGEEKEIFDILNCGIHYKEKEFLETAKYIQMLLPERSVTGLILLTSNLGKLYLYYADISKEKLSITEIKNFSKFYTFGTRHITNFKSCSEGEIPEFLKRCVDINIKADELISEPQIIGGDIQLAFLKKTGEAMILH